MSRDDQPIVVGVDGSDQSRDAIDLGVREAGWRGHPLRLVHAFVWPELGVDVGPAPYGPPEGGLAADAAKLLADALTHAHRAAAGASIEVSGEVVTGSAATVLLNEARDASLVVLGNRGLGGFTGLLVGSVAAQVTTHSPGPVLIARGEPHSDAPVLVGVDGSPACGPAIEFAFAEAAARGTHLIALTTWFSRPPLPEEKLPLIYGADEVRTALARELTAWLTPTRDRFPEVTVREEVRHGRAARTLVAASTEASLVVVGARGRGGFTGLLLGSVSQALLRHSHRPVAVVRSAAD